MNRRGFFQVLGAALSVRQLPRIVPVPLHPARDQLSRILEGGVFCGGAALRIEDISTVMDGVTFEQHRIKFPRRRQ